MAWTSLVALRITGLLSHGPRRRRSVPGWASLLVLTFFVAGCAGESKERSAARARAAYQAGQQSGLQMQHGTLPIAIRGEVKQHKLLWSEGMTLNQAIVQAHYTGFKTPSRIDIIRGGDRYSIDPKNLLRGREDPLVQPGDVIEIIR